MTEFVLEILDGDRAGDVVALGAAVIRIGRRPDNEVVLADEKCSGRHAEIVFEDGRHVVKDLGSTNGTTMDGRRIQEVVLSPRDVVVFGRIRCVYRATDDASAAAAAGGDLADVQVGRVDAAMLAKSGRRRGSLVFTVLFVAVLGAGGFFAWRTYFAPTESRGPAKAVPLAIAGNRLKPETANLEADGGWVLQAVPEGLAFEAIVDRADAHSGNGALLASGIAPGDDGTPAPAFAVATSESVSTSSGQPIKLSAFVRTAGAGRVMLRAVFGAGDDDAFVRTGTAPYVAKGGYDELSLELRAPRGVDRVLIELVALVGGPDDAVYIDDIALRGEGGAASFDASAGSASLTGAGASVRIETVGLPIALGVTPLVTGDRGLAALAALGLLVPSDAGMLLTASRLADESGFDLAWSGGEATGIAFDLPAESANVRTRGAGGRFAVQEAEFAATGVRELLCGTAENRALFRFAADATVRGSVRPGTWRLEFADATACQLVTVFTNDVVHARELQRAATAARDAGRPGDALGQIEELLGTVPHDVGVARQAQELRGEILAVQQREVEALLREAGEAAFFEARVGYQRVIAAIDELFARYGQERVARADELTEMRGKAVDGIAALDAREGSARAELLGTLADAFQQSGNDDLAAFVRDYVQRRHD